MGPPYRILTTPYEPQKRTLERRPWKLFQLLKNCERRKKTIPLESAPWYSTLQVFSILESHREEAFKYFPNAHSIINGLIELLPKRTEVLKQLLEEVETNYQNTPSDIPSSSVSALFGFSPLLDSSLSYTPSPSVSALFGSVPRGFSAFNHSIEAFFL